MSYTVTDTKQDSQNWIQSLMSGKYNLSINDNNVACWWGKYGNLFTQEYHISWGQRPRGIWYSWVNTFSYFLKPACYECFIIPNETKKTHIHVKYCWQAYSKSIGTLSHTFKNHIHNSIVAVACKWCVLSVSDVFLSKDDNSGGKTREISEGMAMIFISRNMIVVLCDHLFWFLPIVQSN